MSEYIKKPLALQGLDDEKIKEAHRYAQQCEWVDAMIAMSKRPLFHDIVGHNLGIEKEYFDDLTEHDDFQLLVSHFIAEMEKCGPQDTDIEDNVIASFENALAMLVGRKNTFFTEHGRFVKKPEIIDRITEDQLYAAYTYGENMFYVEDLFEFDEKLDDIKDEKLLQNIIKAYLNFMHYNYDANASHWDNVSSAHWYAVREAYNEPLEEFCRQGHQQVQSSRRWRSSTQRMFATACTSLNGQMKN